MAKSKSNPAQRERRRGVIVERWRRSGLSVRAFAREHGVSQWTLYSWVKRLAKAGGDDARRPTSASRGLSRSKPRRRIELIPARLVGPDELRRDGHATEGGAGVVEVELRGGDLVRIIGSVPVERIRALLAAVRQPC